MFHHRSWYMCRLVWFPLRSLWLVQTRSWSCPSCTPPPQGGTLMRYSESSILCSWLHRRKSPRLLTGRYTFEPWTPVYDKSITRTTAVIKLLLAPLSLCGALRQGDWLSLRWGPMLRGGWGTVASPIRGLVCQLSPTFPQPAMLLGCQLLGSGTPFPWWLHGIGPLPSWF